MALLSHFLASGVSFSVALLYFLIQAPCFSSCVLTTVQQHAASIHRVDRFAWSSTAYQHYSENASLLTKGSWSASHPEFTSDLIGASASLRSTADSLAHRRVFVIGDSWGREKYKTWVRQLGREAKLPTDDLKYQLGEKDDHMRHTGEGINPDKRSCRFRTGCAGIHLKACGRPGSDDFIVQSKDIKMHFQFKPTHLAKPSDVLLLQDLVAYDPDFVIVDLGRWGASPSLCEQGHYSAAQELVLFFEALNSTTRVPVIVFQSGGGKMKDLNMWDDTSLLSSVEQNRFLRIRVQDILNEKTAKHVHCDGESSNLLASGAHWSEEESPDEVEDDGVAFHRRDVSAVGCEFFHGYSGALMDEVMKMSAQYIDGVLTGH